MDVLNNFLNTIELYFNAFCGIIAGASAVIFMILSLKAWRHKDGVTGAMFFALAALCIMIGVTGLVTAFAMLMALRANTGV